MSSLHDSIPGLIDLFESPDDDERRGAHDALVALGPEAVDTLAANLGFVGAKSREGIVRVLGDIGSTQAIRPLMRFIYEKRGEPADSDARGFAMKAVMELARPEHASRMFDFIMEVREDEDTFVRGYAIEALGRFGDTRARPLLEEATKDLEDFVSERARRALAHLPEGSAGNDGLRSELPGDELLNHIRGSSNAQRTFYVNALLERPDAFELCVQLIREGYNGPTLGLQLLQQLGDPRARSVATSHARVTDDATERAISIRIIGQHLAGDADPDAIQVIDAGLRDSDMFVRMASIAVSGATGHDPLFRRAIKELTNRDPMIALSAAEGLARGASPDMRRALPAILQNLTALRARRHARSEPELVEAEAYTLRALGQIMSGATLGAGDAQRAALASLAAADGHWPILTSSLRTLRDTTPEEGVSLERRWTAAEIAPLIALLEHPEDRVRARAIDLLKRGAPKGAAGLSATLERAAYDDAISLRDDIIPLLEHVADDRARAALDDLSRHEDPSIANLAGDALRRARDDVRTLDGVFKPSDP